MTLPRVLILDDQFGNSIKDRRNLCINFGLKDITGDDSSPELIDDPIAEGVFCSSQMKEKGVIINDLQIAMAAIKGGWPHRDGWVWSMILLDIRFVSGKIGENGEPEGQDGDTNFGLRILEEINKYYPDTPVVILSSRERQEVIEECRKKGALDFIQRVGYSSDITSPRDVLKQKIFDHALMPDTRMLNDERLRMVGNSLSIFKALRSARRAATGKGNILVLGETGTGKELLARYVHDISQKSGGPYVVFHPFGRAETLQEDELFGHVRGAFTGATSDREGLFERAKGGTLFIDEIGDIPEGLQLKLLRPLENRIVKRQGGTKEIPVDFQVVLATNKNLEEYARTGRFKFDLLNRINAYPITIPPLRERKEDIPLVAERLLEILCKEHHARWPRRILPETMELLKNHDWPDNVRGLRNVLERAIKDNIDSELVVPSDIRFDTYAAEASSKERGEEIIKKEGSDLPDSIDELILKLLTFEFSKDYAKISAKLPALQEAVAKMLANYLLSAIEVTKRMKPGTPSDGEINLTGAASCMMGEQLKTPRAADLIKKLLQQDRTILEKLIHEHPALNKAYQEALRLRPKKPVK